MPAASARGDEVGGLGGVESQRFLADDVLPGGEHRPHLLGVQVVGTGDVDHIDLGSAESASRLS